MLVHLSYVCASVVLPSVFSFLNDKLRKYQWIFTKVVMCIDILEICFGFANGQILSFFDRVTCVCNCHMMLAAYYLFSFLFCIINILWNSLLMTFSHMHNSLATNLLASPVECMQNMLASTGNRLLVFVNNYMYKRCGYLLSKRIIYREELLRRSIW